MKSVKVTKDKFEAAIEMLEDGRVKIEFLIPEATEDFNPDDYSYLVDHIYNLIEDKSGKYSVQFQALDAPLTA